MIELVYPKIYCSKIPLPRNPLKELNSYIVVSADRNLIIDTGFNQPECADALFKGIEELGLEIAKTDVLLTHRHSDHTGLASMLEEKGASIYAGHKESIAIHKMLSGEAWKDMEQRAKLFGLDKYGITVDDHPGYRFRPQPFKKCTTLKAGDVLRYGEYNFEVVDIPGHTPGHIGLYEAQHKLFFCGDHILASITPNITFWGFEQDSLAQYFASLRKVAAMQIEWLFTAHREIVRDHKARISELIEHHETRLAEIMHILGDGKKNASEVAALMHWDIKAKSWEDFPKAQKWFATGEATAHLEYLVNLSKLQRTTIEGTMYYQFQKA